MCKKCKEKMSKAVVGVKAMREQDTISYPRTSEEYETERDPTTDADSTMQEIAEYYGARPW